MNVILTSFIPLYVLWDMKENNKDTYSKVLECIWCWADCECCWTYDLWATNLDCWCQLYDEYEVWTMVICPYCNWDYEDESDL